jgi:hypothetical protein
MMARQQAETCHSEKVQDLAEIPDDFAKQL